MHRLISLIIAGLGSSPTALPCRTSSCKRRPASCRTCDMQPIVSSTFFDVTDTEGLPSPYSYGISSPWEAYLMQTPSYQLPYLQDAHQQRFYITVVKSLCATVSFLGKWCTHAGGGVGDKLQGARGCLGRRAPVHM